MSEHYRLSGAVPLAGGGMLFCWTPLAGMLAGAAYAAVQHFVPYLYIWVGLVIAFPWVVASTAASLSRRGRVRNVTVAAMVAFLSALLGYYVMWATHLWLFTGRLLGFFLCLDPRLLWIHAQIGFQQGFWSFRGEQVSGVGLAVLWAVEFGLMVLVSPFAAVATLRKNAVFCEDCQKWLIWEHLPICLALTPDGDLKRRLIVGDYEALVDAPQPTAPLEPHARLQVACCPDCQELIVLRVDETRFATNAKAETQVRQTPLVKAARLDKELALKILKRCAPRREECVSDEGELPPAQA